MNDLRLEFRTRNNPLWHAIFDTHASVAEFCRQNELHQTEVGKILNLKVSPYLQDGSPSALALKLSTVTGYSVEYLFPPDIYHPDVPRAGVAEVSSARFVALSEARRIALPPSQDDELESEEMGRVIEAALLTITKREADVLRAMFGLDGSGERSQEEIAEEFGISRARVYQIRAKAMRRMRHPARAKHLRTYLE